MKKIKIYLGTSNNHNNSEPSSVANIAARYFEGATVYDAFGLWRGALELSVVVEVYGDEEELKKAEQLAVELKQFFAQESVLVTASECQEVLFI